MPLPRPHATARLCRPQVEELESRVLLQAHGPALLADAAVLPPPSAEDFYHRLGLRPEARAQVAGRPGAPSSKSRRLKVTLALDPTLDQGHPGVVESATVTLLGQTAPRALVRLTNSLSPAFRLKIRADAHGRFRTQVPLQLGANRFLGQATDAAKHRASVVLSLQRMPPSIPMSPPTHPTLPAPTTLPTAPVIDLARTSDTNLPGDHHTSAGRVVLVGQADPGATVSLIGTGQTARADATGRFQFPNVPLAPGVNSFAAQVSNAAGNNAFGSVTITRDGATNPGNTVLDWNQHLLDAIQQDASDPLYASRTLAMVQAAVFDVVNALDGTPARYVKLTAPPDADADAAVAAAAHRVLSYLYPSQQATFDSELTASLNQVPDGPGKTDGIALGQSAADAILALRAHDGYDTFAPYTQGTGPGTWQPTAPMFAEALDPQWADLQPWVMTAPDQFLPPGPAALTSQQWADAFNEVKSRGSATSTTRTPDQTQTARFWADGMGSYTPPGHWNQIAAQLAQQQGDSLGADARLFAELDGALADAAIVAWNAKYHFVTWRPITAIQNAASAANPNVQADATWQPLLVTPPFPEYVSGHSTFSSAAATVLDAFFGNSVGFTATSVTLPGVSRSFTSFDQAAAEAGQSRIYGGIHFQFANQDGLAAGRALGQYVLQTFDVGQDTNPPHIALDNVLPSGASNQNVIVTGEVTDNLTGVATLGVQIDQGSFTALALSAAGHFQVPTTFLLDGTADGRHTLNFRATDAAGNVSAIVPFSFTLDTKAPTVTLTSPANNASISGSAMLTGNVPADGSPIAALGYRLDAGGTVPVSVDASSGTFSQALDLSRLAVGMHTLTVSARDAAGNMASSTQTFTLTAAVPFTITSIAPQNGATDVGVTFRPKFVFARPVDPATLNENNLFVTDTSGAKLPATIRPADDGSFAWLFFTSQLPGSSTLTLTVDGSTIEAPDGTLLDAAGNGTAGSKWTSTFTTVSRTFVPNTTLSGIVADPGPDLKPGTFDDVRSGPDGVLMTGDDLYQHPLAGVTVYILGMEEQAVMTGSDGSFRLTNVPTGDVKLVLNGRTATNAPAGFYFPEMVMDLTVRPGVDNTVMGTMGTLEEQAANTAVKGVYLPRLRNTILQSVADSGMTQVGVEATSAPNLTPEQRPFLSIEVPGGSLVGMDGQKMSGGTVGISTVPPELVRDMLPPGVLQHTFDITIQAPDVATFATPAAMTFPNVFHDPPGTKENLLSFDHTTGRLLIEGTATVSADGLSVRTDPGTGITHPGWHGLINLINQLLGRGRGPWENITNPNLGSALASYGEAAFETVKGTIEAAGVLIENRVLEAAETVVSIVGLGTAIDELRDCSGILDCLNAAAKVGIEGTIVGGALLITPEVIEAEEALEGTLLLLDTKTLLGALGTTVSLSSAVDKWQEGNELLEEGEREADAALEAHLKATEQLQMLQQLENKLHGITQQLEQVNNAERQLHNEVRDMLSQHLQMLQIIAQLLDNHHGGFYDPTNPGDQPGIDGNGNNPPPDAPPGTAPNNTLVVPPPSGAGTSYPPNDQHVIDEQQQQGGGIFLVPPPSRPSQDVGDTLASALPVTVPLDGGFSIEQTIGDNAFGAQDVDVYRFDASAGNTLTIDVSKRSTGLLYVYARLFDASGHELAANVADGLDATPHIGRFTVPATGTYFLGVSSWPNTAYDPQTAGSGSGGQFTGDYRLTIERLAGLPTLGVLFRQARLNLLQASRNAAVNFLKDVGATPARQAQQALDEFDKEFLLPGSMAPMGSLYVTLLPLDGGPAVRTRAGREGSFGAALSPNTDYRLFLFDPVSRLTTVTPVHTGRVGGTTTLPPLFLGADHSPDTDGDGLSDNAEIAIGSSPAKADTNGDGISDLAAIQQGLNPLGKFGFPTGVIASLPLNGQAQDVAVIGSPLDSESQTAYVATGSAGLAVVDATQFDRPVVLGQLALLGGNATGVAVDAGQGIAAVADGSTLVLVDVSNMTAPVVQRTVTVPATQVQVIDGIAYAAGGNTLTAVDLATGEVIQVLRFAGSATLTGLAHGGQMLYVMDSRDVLRAVDVSSFQMRLRGSATLRAGGGKLFVAGNTAYAVAADSFSGGFASADVSNPDQFTNFTLWPAPGPLGVPRSAFVPTGSGDGILAGREGSGKDSLTLVNLRGATPGVTTQVLLPAQPLGVALASGIAYVADGSAGLQVVNYFSFDTGGQAPTPVSISGPAGTQVIEGSTIPVQVTARDDVQVRNVELLVNGQVVANDVSAPFGFFATAPTLATQATQVILQARATDTGGNVALSSSLTYNLVPDGIPPELGLVNPPDGAIRGMNVRSIFVPFSELLDQATLIPSNFTVQGPGGNVSLRVIPHLGGRVAQLVLGTLTPGSYQLTIHSAGLWDPAGNKLGSTDLVRSFTIVPATEVYIGPANGDWNDPTNWDTGLVPGATDDVYLTQPLSISSGTVTIHSLRSGSAFTLNGATLQVTGPVQIDNTFTISAGTLMGATVLPGTGGQGLRVLNTPTLDGLTLQADLLLPGGGIPTVRNGLTLNGSTITLSNSGGGGGASGLSFQGTQTLGGTGTIVFAGVSDSNFVQPANSSTTLTIGSNITLQLTSRGGGLGNGFDVGGFDNRGHVVVTNQTASLHSAWSNAGVIDATNASFVLGGTFTPSALGTFNRTGTTITIVGTLDLSSDPLSIDSGTVWNVNNGTLQNGTVAIPAGKQLNLFGSFGVLDGVSFNGDVLFNGGALRTVHDGLTLLNGSTITLANSGGGGGATGLSFQGTQTLGGTGTIVFAGGSDSNFVQPANSSTTLTIGQNITLQLTSRGGGLGNGFDVGAFVNQGHVVVTGQNATLHGAWSNAGVIDATNASFVLAGTFTPSALGTFHRTGTTITVTGTLDLTGNPLTIDSGTVWNVNNASLQNGTVAIPAGQQLNLFGSSAVLDGVSFDGDVLFHGGAQGTVRNGLTLLNGSTITLANTGGGGGATGLSFQGTQTLDGTGTIVFAGVSDSNFVQPANSSTTLTIGQNITIQLTSRGGGLGNGFDVGGFDNRGHVVVTNQTASLHGAWSNAGVIDATNASFVLAGTFTPSALGTFHRTGTTITVTGTLNLSTALNIDNGTVWNVNNATLQNGTVSIPAGKQLNLFGSSAVLDGVSFDGDVLFHGGAQGTVRNGLTLLNGSTITLANTGGGGGASGLSFQGTQALGGTGTIVFAGVSDSNFVQPANSSTMLTIGPSITLQLTSRGGGLGNGFDLGAFVNQGHVVVTGQTASLHGAWSNAGVIDATNANFVLGGTFTPSALGTFNRTGTTITIIGTVNLSNTPLSIDSGTVWNVSGNGTLRNGTISIPAGKQLNLFGSSGVLDGTAFDGDVLLTGGAQWTVRNGLTLLNGSTITLANTGGGGGASGLSFQGTQALGGTGTIVFAGASDSNFVQPANSSTTLTIGPNITLRTGSHGGGIGNGFNLGAVMNNGTIQALTPGHSFSLHGAFTNSGTLDVLDGNTVTASAGFTQTSAGTLIVHVGGPPAGNDFSKLAVTGTANLAGTLSIILANGFTPSAGDLYTIVTATTVNGTFDALTGTDLGNGLAFHVTYDTNKVTLGVS
jgi:hypothetical protein